MNFYNYSGPKTKDDVLTLIDDYINAYNALEKVGINNPIFENGNASCINVVKEFENLKNIVNVFANDGEYGNDNVDKKHGFDIDRLFGIEIKTYDDLNKAIFERINFLKKSLYKEVTETKYVEKPVTKSIDKNTFFTSVIATFAISSSFLIRAFCDKLNFIFGIGVFVAAIIMILFKKRFFGNTIEKEIK